MAGLGLTLAGIGLVLTAVWLKLRGWNAWRVPLYVGAGVNLILGYTPVLTRVSLLAVAVSVALAAVCFVMQWVERTELEKLKLSPVLTYVGAGVMLVAAYLATRIAQFETAYSLVTIAVGGLGLMAASWYLYRLQNDTPAKRIYEKPLWYMGVAGLVAALVLLIPTSNYLAGALGYAVAALAFGLHAWFRRDVWFGYAGGAAIVVSMWWLLRYFNVTEVQAFVIPLGVLSLVIGWNELRIGRRVGFQAATVFGLVILMGSAFYQSLGNVNYAVLLLVESVAAFVVGVRMRSRFYVEAAILALVGNGLVQYGPALVELPRWVQIGAIGSILVTGGLLALFRRQRLLEMRSAFTNQWKMWKP